MPRLIYKGNIIENFGRFLPAPYIDTVVIGEEEFTVTIALFVEADEDEDEDDILEDLKLDELTYYLIISAEESSQTLEGLLSKTVRPFELVNTSIYYNYLAGKDVDGSYYAQPYRGPEKIWDAGDQFEDTLEATGLQSVRSYYRDYEGGVYDEDDDEYQAYQYAWTPDGVSQMVTFSSSDFELADTTYTPDGKRILKYTVSTSAITEFHDSDTYAQYFMGDSATDPDTLEWNEDGPHEGEPFNIATLENWGNINVYAFSSLEDLTDADGFAATGTHLDRAGGLENSLLLNLNTSNVSYEKIIENNAVRPQTEVAWLDKQGNPYDGVPLQSMTSEYYKAEKITHKAIVKNFENLVDEYEKQRESNSALDGALTNISYVLGVYGEQADLIPQLNLLRKTFPSTSTATPVGRLYVRFRKRIFNNNLTIVKEGKLFKQLIVNPKIVDSREVPAESWTQGLKPSYQYVGDDVDLGGGYEAGVYSTVHSHNESPAYAGLALFSDNGATTDQWWVTVEEVAADSAVGTGEGRYNIITSGFIFFDFEKVAQSSSLSQVLDVAMVEDYFGKEITSERIQYVKARLTRGPTEESDIDYSSDLIDEYGYGEIAGDEYDQTIHCFSMTNNIPAECYVARDAQSRTALATWGNKKSYMYPRSFNLASENGLGGYRLACFEFQDLMGGNDNLLSQETDFDTAYDSSTLGTYFGSDGNDDPQWQYVFQLSLQDYTLDIVGELITNYQTNLAIFEEYKDQAAEICGYNNVDGHFNQFFIDAMTEEHGSDLANAPWIMMPLVFCIHSDLVFNQFNGDVDSAIEEAKSISMKISPYTGILDEVESFWTRVETLYSENYGGGTSTIGGATENLMDSSTLVPGSSDYFEYYNIVYNDIPTIAQLGNDVDSWSQLVEGEMPTWWIYQIYGYGPDIAARDSDGTEPLSLLYNGVWDPSDPPGADDYDADTATTYGYYGWGGGSFDESTGDLDYGSWSIKIDVAETMLADIKTWLEAAQALGQPGFRSDLESIGTLDSISASSWYIYYINEISDAGLTTVPHADNAYAQIMIRLAGFFFCTMGVYPELTLDGLIEYFGLDANDYISVTYGETS